MTYYSSHCAAVDHGTAAICHWRPKGDACRRDKRPLRLLQGLCMIWLGCQQQLYADKDFSTMSGLLIAGTRSDTRSAAVTE